MGDSINHWEFGKSCTQKRQPASPRQNRTQNPPLTNNVCVSGFGVGQSPSSLVCRSQFVVCDSVREWWVLGSILAGSGKLSLLCTGLPQFSIIIIIIIILIIISIIIIIIIIIIIRKEGSQKKW